MHQGCLLRADEHPLAHLARVPVDAGADVGEELWYIMNFIEDHGKREPVEEAARVGAGTGLEVGVLEEHVGGIGEKLP